MRGLRGRTAVVTGGGRGIGAAAALALAKAGVTVAVVARNNDQVVEMAARLRHGGHEAFAFTCDVTNSRDVREAAMGAQEAMGRVDILVNGAATAKSNYLERVTLEEWNHVMAVNATGTFLFTKALLPAMVERGWGRVVNVASLAGLRGITQHVAAHTAARHAVVGFTRAVAMDVAGTGVTVNALCPGFMDTPFTHEQVADFAERTGRTFEETKSALLRQAGQYRFIPPTEVADAIVELCRQRSADINGEAIAMDGGGWEG